MGSFLVDPDNITDYNLSDDGLELVLLFWIAAAGKNAKTSARALNALLEEGSQKFGSSRPFEIIIGYGDTLAESMKKQGMGCYNNKSRSMSFLANSGINLRTCNATELETVPGIGPKTARCFLIHSREGVRHAGLDTHVLKYMRDLGFDVPKSTPTGKKYIELENLFLELADKSGLEVADFDLQIWRRYSGSRRSKAVHSVGD